MIDCGMFSRYVIWIGKFLLLIWILTLGLHIQTSVQTSSPTSKRVELGPDYSVEIKSFINTGRVRTIGIPYFLHLKYDTLPRSVNVVIELHGFKDDSKVFMKVLDRHTNQAVRHEHKAGTETILKKFSLADESGYRYGCNLPDVIDSDGELPLFVILSVVEDGAELRSEIVEIQISQKQAVRFALGWQILFMFTE